jgi:hypothetical protein
MIALKGRLPSVPQPKYHANAARLRRMRPSGEAPLPAEPIDDTVDAMLAALDANSNGNNSNGTIDGISVMNPSRPSRPTPPVPTRPLVPAIPPPIPEEEIPLISPTPPSPSKQSKTFSSLSSSSLGSNSHMLTVPSGGRSSIVTSLLPITPPRISTPPHISNGSTHSVNNNVMNPVAAARITSATANMHRSTPSTDDTPILTMNLPPLTHPSPSSLTVAPSIPSSVSVASTSVPTPTLPLYYQLNIVRYAQSTAFWCILRVVDVVYRCHHTIYHWRS